ncbi:MAG: TRAM domain-containing protein [Bdellovibrionota bacterium]|nr:TRAM domain-containing protein [Bdellovibrionota bacterium]
MEEINKGSKVEVFIEKMSFGGAGIARIDNLVVFVSGAAPQETAIVEITKKKKRFAEAKLVQILSPSPFRRETPCKYTDKCGACQWQQFEYEEQLKQKQTIFHEMLDKVDFLKGLRASCIISGNEFRYRNRIQIRTKSKKLGFFQKASNEIVNIKDCLITEEMLTTQFNSILKKQPSTKMQKFELLYDKNHEVVIRKNKGHGEEDGFSQVNDQMNKKMQNWVLEQISDINCTGKIFDLYAGNGNFSRFLEQNSIDKPLMAIEFSEAAIQRGKKLAGPNSKIEWLSAKVENVVKNIKADENSVLIIDPPRIGCDEKFIDSLKTSGAKDLIYISCNPSTWIRDLQRLKEHRDFTIESLELLDMFPQTYHIEVLSRVRLK